MRGLPALTILALATACRGESPSTTMPECPGEVLVDATNATSIARDAYVRFGTDSALLLGSVAASDHREFVLRRGATGVFVFASSADSSARAAGKPPVTFTYRCL